MKITKSITLLMLTVPLMTSCYREGKSVGHTGKNFSSYRVILEKHTGQVENKNEPWYTGHASIGGADPDPVYFFTSVQAALKDMTGIPDYVEDNILMINNCSSIKSLLHKLHRISGIQAGGYGPPLNEQLIKGKPNHQFIPRGKRELCTPELSATINNIVNLMLHANGLMEDALPAGLFLNTFESDKSSKDLSQSMSNFFIDREAANSKYKSAFSHIDLHLIAYSSRLIAEGMSQVIESLDMGKDTHMLKQNFEFSSPVGLIGIFGNGADTIENKYSLVIDLGGNDFYPGGAAVASPFENTISINIDMGGNDIYGSRDQETRICGSTMGLSYLYDHSGNDSYFSESFSMASCMAGSSIMVDNSGDDHYISTGPFSQASAFFGYSLMVDLSGTDRYFSGDYSQGFGGTKGIALLTDFKGDDKYISNGASFCQGAAKGRWADAGDGHNMGGGYGILADREGKDLYMSGSFSQGASYFNGFGIMADTKGDDSYNAESHSQGAASHNSVACFIDFEGNDNYNTDIDPSKISQITGYGRDRSCACFLELSGNDKYLTGNKSFGVGDISATGIVIEMDGNDSYNWNSNSIYPGSKSFGKAQDLTRGMELYHSSLRFYNRYTTGIMLDLGGKDKYINISDEEIIFFSDGKKESSVINNKISIRKDK